MKKFLPIGLAVLFLSAHVSLRADENISPKTSKNAATLLFDYFSGVSLDLQEIDANADKENESLPTPQEVKQAVESAAAESCPHVEPIQDINDYIEEIGNFEQSGQLNEWEKKRSQLYKYVQTSNWHTRKNISDADRSFMKTIETIFLGLIKEGLAFCGADSFFDRIDERRLHELESNEEIQYAKDAVVKDITEALTSEHHALNELYVRIQNNAFELLSLNYVDYKKLSAAFPEVHFLFEDLYTFFKWRWELRLNDPAYKLNENNIESEFRATTHTNSFFAWWELSNIAKAHMRDGVKEKSEGFTDTDPQEERDNMDLYHIFSKRAHYFGRLWNGVQKYAVVHSKVLPKERKPKRGAQKPRIIRNIRKSMQPLSKEQVSILLEDIRKNYIEARAKGEVAWKAWREQYIETQEKIYREELEQALAEILE